MNLGRYLKMILSLSLSCQLQLVMAQNHLQLEELLVEAQTAYFTANDLHRAISSFEKIAEFRSSPTLNLSEKKAIHYALLRLSQLSEHDEAQNRWLEKAFRFAPHLSPEEELFPPPLVSKYENLRKKQIASENSHRNLAEVPVNQLMAQKDYDSSTSSSNQPAIDLQVSKTHQNVDKPVYKNKWLWIGLGVVATSIAIHQINQSKSASGSDNNTPTVTHGL